MPEPFGADRSRDRRRAPSGGPRNGAPPPSGRPQARRPRLGQAGASPSLASRSRRRLEPPDRRRQDWLEFNGRLGYAIVPARSFPGAPTCIAATASSTPTWKDGSITRRRPDVRPSVPRRTPDAHYRPKVSAGGGIAARLHQQPGIFRATVFTLDGRYQEYVTGRVRTVKPGIEQYLFDGKVWITAQSINTIDEFDRYQRRLSRSRRPDAARRSSRFHRLLGRAGELRRYTVETRALFGGIVYDVDTSTALRLSLSHEQRPAQFDRTTVSVGAAYKF